MLACVQAKLLCTTSRAQKVVVAFTLAALLVQAVNLLLWKLADVFIAYSVTIVLFHAVVPVVILIINVMVVREVHRASTSAAGLHHHSTPSNSSVPTVMLVTTSLVYVLIYGTWSILFLVMYYSRSIDHIVIVASGVTRLVFAYNFFIYLITGKQFRAELRRLFCGPRSAAAVLVDDDADGVARRGQINTAV